ncbi:hypothetical protein [Actinomadura sp. 3N508]|uniref:hypothetical protein n=1 Tax=Actinomadura sp. 3N508 TaxID=3375153 RepID=UPI0037B23E50
MIAGIGGVEFRFQAEAFHTVAVYLKPDEPTDGGRVPLTGPWPMEKRSSQAIRDLLALHDVSWERDETISARCS